jgi:hypothetical protein
LATELEIYGDVKLRDALREDEERIAKYLIAIMNSESDRAAVLRLEGDFAQYFLDVVQNVGCLPPFGISPSDIRY